MDLEQRFDMYFDKVFNEKMKEAWFCKDKEQIKWLNSEEGKNYIAILTNEILEKVS